MYTGYGFRNFQIGDVDVIRHDGLYHLFHLVLPRHSYIAHAVSHDGLHWRRVQNALFIGDPPAFDDDMLWTMHITPDPHRPHAWRMFYTGLGIQDDGRIQRVGLARSEDLYHWQKDTSGHYPLEIGGPHYESRLEEGRHWISFRDPFFFQEDGQNYLIAAARVKRGPIIRRGCVALAQETGEDTFELCPPLFHPHRYDDVEVPNLIRVQDRYYLIGSIREDIKVHYWMADDLQGPYRNFSDNVLLPQGNYAARVSGEDDRWLVWNLFFRGLTTQGKHLLAPPKELVVNSNGELRLKSFYGFDDLVHETYSASELAPLETLFDNPGASGATETTSCWFEVESGLDLFLLHGRYEDVSLSGEYHLDGEGKIGLVLRLNEKGDGYYLSLDPFKGIVQLRAWRHRQHGELEHAFEYEQLQAAHYVPTGPTLPFRLIAYEQYLEFSLNGYVLLTLADDHFRGGRLGFYVESARARVENLQLSTLVSS
jgi:beta-fructofuranosidase